MHKSVAASFKYAATLFFMFTFFLMKFSAIYTTLSYNDDVLNFPHNEEFRTSANDTHSIDLQFLMNIHAP